MTTTRATSPSAPRPLALATAGAPRRPTGAAPAPSAFPAISTPKTRNPHSTPPPPSSSTFCLSSAPFHGQIDATFPQISQPLPQSVAATASQCGTSRPGAQPPGQPPGSYQDALLGGGAVAPMVGQAALDVVDNGWSRNHVLAPIPPSTSRPAISVALDADEGWQVVQSRRCHASCDAPLLPIPKSYSSRYLAAVADRCLNCLSSSHRRAACRLPTRCFNCRGLGHHLRHCKHPRKPPRLQTSGGFELCTEACGSVLQVPRVTLLPCEDGGTTCTITLKHIITSGFPEPEFVFPAASSCFNQRLWDPMVEEAMFRTLVHNPLHGYQEEVFQMEEQLASSPPSVLSPDRHNPVEGSPIPPSTAMPSRTDNHHPPTEEIQTPELFRSEAEQLVGQELIKALSNLKQLVVVSSSPHPQQFNSCVKESIVEHPRDIQFFNHHCKTKIKSRKPVVKVVRDMLTRKWVVVKRHKLNIITKISKLDKGKLQEYADHLKDLLPPNLFVALMSLEAHDFWDIVVTLSSSLG